MPLKPLIISERNQEFLFFLKENKQTILQSWEDQIHYDATDSLELIHFNGTVMFDLVVDYLSGHLKKAEVTALAERVAFERAQAQVNLGHFITNVYQGREVLLDQLSHIDLTIKEFIQMSQTLSSLFDQFVHCAVSRYSELKDAEIREKLLFINDTHKDRLTLLGQMSSSFVHEFRNPLTAVMGFIKLIRSGDTNPLYFDTIEHELEELKYRITRFLHTSKIKTEDESFQNISIKALIEELLNFLYPTLVSDDIQVDTHFSFTGYTLAKMEELKQVCLNLLMNAIEAVKTNSHTSYIKASCELEEDRIKIEISNNGPKIPEHALQTIFEPFYTTKELGTGIGLYVCKQIIELHHGGHISCRSDDTLTVFTIYLPIRCDTL